jgi:hypothetical protein
MELVETENGWQIRGEGSERARVAYARESNGSLEVTFEQPERPASLTTANA